MMHAPLRPPARAQRGVVMVITLVVLALLLVGGVALVRSSDTYGTLSGQLAFRRDLKNQGERGLARALALLDSGTLSSASARLASLAAANYSAVQLSANDEGLPQVLLADDTAFAEAGMSASDIEDSDSGVRVRTVIDRQCSAAGEVSSAGCTRVPMDCSSKGIQTQNGMGGQVIQCYGTAYRLSVRVDGPRSTQAFFQMTVAR